MVINTNITAQTSAGLLASSSASLAKSLQRLSSGSKITSPEDDAAGLAVSMRFSSQSNRIMASENNVSNAISYTQTQDGFLGQISKALDRMSELAVSAQDITKTVTDQGLYNKEFAGLQAYIADIQGKTFNGVSLFATAAGTQAITTDSEGNNNFAMAKIDLSSIIGTGQVTDSGALTVASATALTTVSTAINTLADRRAQIGANMTRLNYSNDQLKVQRTNIDAANSRIKDVDVATESTNYAKLNILVQSGTAMLAQANTMPQSVLRLLG